MAIDHHLDSAHDGPFSVHADQRGDTCRVVLRGEFDIAAVAAVQDAVARAFDGRPATLELDLSQLSFLDSSGLRAILEVRDRASDRDVALALVPGSPAVQRVFQITGLDEVLPFRGS